MYNTTIQAFVVCNVTIRLSNDETEKTEGGGLDGNEVSRAGFIPFSHETLLAELAGLISALKLHNARIKPWA